MLYFLYCIFCVVFLPCFIFCVICFRVVFFVLYFFVLYFSVFYLKAFHSMQQIILIYVWHIFVQTLKRKVSHGFGQLGLIHYLVIFLFLFRNYLSVSKLNFLLIFLLLFLICSLHKQ